MAEEEEELEYKSGVSKGMVAMVAVGMLLLGAGGGGAAAWFMTQESGEVAEGKTASEDGPRSEDRALVPLEPFTVNLRGSGSSRVLRLEVQLEVLTGDQETITTAVPQLRDAVLSLASDYTFNELEGIDGKLHLRDELLVRMNRVLEDARIERIYFTEFVVQ